jgi:hypothetical protein
MIQLSPRKEFSVSEFWWALIWLTLFIPFFCLWGFAVWDILSARHDLRGWAKALWIFGLLVLPLIGVLAYFIARPKGEGFEEYASPAPYGYGGYGYYPYRPAPVYSSGPQRASGPAPAANDLDTLNRLRDTGTITDAEYSDLTGRLSEQQRPAA